MIPSLTSSRRAWSLARLESIEFFSGLGDSAHLLYGLARAMKPRVAVEIGSARGRSACFVGMALKENGLGRLYAIDPHTQTAWNDLESVDTFLTMRRHVADFGLDGIIEMVRSTSADAAATWNEKIDLLFIDGDHSYEGVKADWERFSPFVSEFGVVVFHDTIWDRRPDPRYAREDMGVPLFVEELRIAGYPVVTVDHDFGVSIVQPKIGGVTLAKVEATV
ncbi:MAG TPA: class I SAM-dependent methyltransferase [Gemmatimonadaceae bacterium]|jgi:predicted O-methyltransferase YrrM